MKSIECVGQTNEGWTVFEAKPNKLKARHPCGAIRTFRSPKEFLTNTQRCIRCQQKTKTPLENIYYIYEQNASNRKLDFELSTAEFSFLIGTDCFYCGAKPSTLEKGRWKNGEWYEEFLRNGLDRSNSDIGYSLSNCVPCCFRCNKLKGNLGLEEFVGAVQAVYSNMLIPEPL